MNIERNPYSTSTLNSEKESKTESSTENLRERGAEVYAKAEQAMSDAYDKTSEKVGETYDKAMIYSSENPGTTVLIAFGIGLGLGLLLGSSATHRSSNRFAQPVINALSGAASEIFR
jgi:ElaB/YqjD/DUF883 family membrane-anchored ribosome-binding protein